MKTDRLWVCIVCYTHGWLRGYSANTRYNQKYSSAGNVAQQFKKRDLHNYSSGHYNDRGVKSRGDEERGRERDKYNATDKNRDR